MNEPLAEALRLRYGAVLDVNPAVEPFLRHRSIRKFADRPVDDATVRGLIAAAQSAATSSNLQLWTAVTVQDPERREAIAMLCADQNQVRTCGVFLAFLADVYRLREAAQAQGESAEALDFAEFYTMALVDAALAAERLVCAAEAMGLGICYIGALRNDPAGVAELLDLPDGTFGVFGLCVGWPAEPVRSEIKPRLRPEAVWHRERYNRDADTAEYDARMAEFYAHQRMSGDATWSKRSGERARPDRLTGREVLLEWLRSHGWLRR